MNGAEWPETIPSETQVDIRTIEVRARGSLDLVGHFFGIPLETFLGFTSILFNNITLINWETL